MDSTDFYMKFFLNLTPQVFTWTFMLCCLRGQAKQIHRYDQANFSDRDASGTGPATGGAGRWQPYCMLASPNHVALPQWSGKINSLLIFSQNSATGNMVALVAHGHGYQLVQTCGGQVFTL